MVLGGVKVRFRPRCRPVSSEERDPETTGVRGPKTADSA